MKEAFGKLLNSTKVAILVLVVAILGFAITSFGFFTNLMDIPLGILLSGFIISGLNLLTSLAYKLDAKKDSATMTVVMINVKLFVGGGLLVLICFMYFRWNMPFFNPFAYIGVYTAYVIITIVVHLIERNRQ